MKRIDLSRVGLTDHAIERWAERIGLPAWQLRSALVRSVPAHRRLRRRLRESRTDGRWPGPTRIRTNRAVGAVFVLAVAPDRSSGHARLWSLVTVLPLWSCRAGGDVGEVREDEPCSTASL